MTISTYTYLEVVKPVFNDQGKIAGYTVGTERSNGLYHPVFETFAEAQAYQAAELKRLNAAFKAGEPKP